MSAGYDIVADHTIKRAIEVSTFTSDFKVLTLSLSRKDSFLEELKGSRCRITSSDANVYDRTTDIQLSPVLQRSIAIRVGDDFLDLFWSI
jgi:hypothetical protein